MLNGAQYRAKRYVLYFGNGGSMRIIKVIMVMKIISVVIKNNSSDSGSIIKMMTVLVTRAVATK